MFDKFLLGACVIAGTETLVAAYFGLAPLIGSVKALLIVLGIVVFAAALTWYAMR